MQSTEEFIGLGMPVFTAFGWAGEEAAIKYALSQLELFIANLHMSLPTALKNELPVYGLVIEDRSVFLAVKEEIGSDLYIAFFARPTSLELQLTLVDKAVLAKGLKQIEKDPVNFHRLLRRLGPDWDLRVQQIHINEESGEQGHYQDIFKDKLDTLSEETAVDIFNKAAYLNSESKWITPIYISQRIPSEQVSAMGTAVIDVINERLDLLLPVMYLLTGRSPRKTVAKKTKTAAPRKLKPQAAKSTAVPALSQADEFTYVTEIKPLFLRKGVINMTPQHWPFFAINARTETRRILLLGAGIRDTNSNVWRLQPSEMARLVLSARAHGWLEDNFVTGDKVQLTATKINENEIQILIEAVR